MDEPSSRGSRPDVLEIPRVDSKAWNHVQTVPVEMLSREKTVNNPKGGLQGYGEGFCKQLFRSSIVVSR